MHSIAKVPATIPYMIGVMFGVIPAKVIHDMMMQKIQIMIVPAVTRSPFLSVYPFHLLYPAK